MPSYKLTYFDLTGVVEPIRYIFAYAGQAYEDNRIKFADWPALKPNTPFGKMPLLEVDGKVITQSNTIARYLANKFGLTGKDEWEALRAEELVDTLGDLKQQIYRIHFEKEEKAKGEIKKEVIDVHLPFYLGKFEKIVADNPSGLLVGSQVTWADFVLADNLTNFQDTFPGVPGLLKQYPALNGLVNKVYSLPSIKAWIDKRPPNPPWPTS